MLSGVFWRSRSLFNLAFEASDENLYSPPRRFSNATRKVNAWQRAQAKSISILLSFLLERNLNHELCSLSRLGNTSQATMMFFYYNLVANSQP